VFVAGVRGWCSRLVFAAGVRAGGWPECYILTQLSRSLIRPERHLAPALERERKAKPDPGRQSEQHNPARALCESWPDSSVVERGPEKAGVGGSIPSLATIYNQ
jgi:hypothetical protein